MFRIYLSFQRRREERLILVAVLEDIVCIS